MEETTINWQYNIKQILFEDLLSFTYLGESIADKEVVIICMYKKEYLSPETVTKLMFFGDQIKALKHPNLLSLIDFFCYNDNFYAIYPYEKRLISLGAYLKENPITLSSELRKKILDSVLSVMELLEAKRLVCGNLSLYSVFLTQNFEVKLLNIIFPLIILKPNLDDFEILEDGIFYAPEFLINKEFTIKSDVYAFGVLSYYLNTNTWPYEYETDIDNLKKNIFNKPLPLQEINPQIPFYIQQVTSIAMAKDSEKRFSSFLRIREALNEKKDLSSLMHDLDTPPASFLNALENVKKKQKKQFFNKLKLAALIFAALFTIALGYFGYLLYLNSIPTISIPNVIGLPAEEAINILKDNKLQAEVGGEVIRAGIPAGYVVETRPPVGRLVKADRAVQIYIAKEGPTNVPDLLNKSFVEAESIAKSRNLILKMNKEIYSENYPEGIIMAEDPSPNSQINVNSEILVTVSKGFPVTIFMNEEDLALNPDEITVVVNFSIPAYWTGKMVAIYKISGNTKEKIYSIKHQPGEVISKQFTLNLNDTIKVYFDNNLALTKQIISGQNNENNNSDTTSTDEAVDTGIR